MIDEKDRKILDLLQQDARLSNAQIGEAVGLTTSTVHERVKKLERRGVIKKYVALVDPGQVQRPITAFIRLVLGETTPGYYKSGESEFIDQCRQEPDVLECHSVAGEDCYVLKVRAASPQELETLLRRLRSLAPVVRSTTSIVLTTFKEETAVFIPDPQ